MEFIRFVPQTPRLGIFDNRAARALPRNVEFGQCVFGQTQVKVFSVKLPQVKVCFFVDGPGDSDLFHDKFVISSLVSVASLRRAMYSSFLIRISESSSCYPPGPSAPQVKVFSI